MADRAMVARTTPVAIESWTPTGSAPTCTPVLVTRGHGRRGAVRASIVVGHWKACVSWNKYAMASEVSGWLDRFIMCQPNGGSNPSFTRIQSTDFIKYADTVCAKNPYIKQVNAVAHDGSWKIQQIDP